MTSQLTSPYPDNPRSGWAQRFIVAPHYDATGLLNFAVEFFANQRAIDRAELPFLVNSWKAQVRETHQRIMQTTPLFFRHISGIDVPIDDIDTFLESDSRAYRYVGLDTDGKRLDRDGKTPLAPFMFPTYQGVPEGLDPQWVRELYTKAQADQVAAFIEAYKAGAEGRRLSGDHRGTTLDLQVGASTDDTIVVSTSTIDNTSTRTPAFMHTASDYGFGCRWTNVTIGNSDTIDTSLMTWRSNTTATPSETNTLFGEDADDAATFSTRANFDARPQTTASASYVLPAVTNGSDFDTPELKTIWQEVVNRGGWASGQDVALLQDPRASGSASIYGRSYDQDTGTAPKLHIEFTAAAGGIVVLRRRREGE